MKYSRKVEKIVTLLQMCDNKCKYLHVYMKTDLNDWFWLHGKKVSAKFFKIKYSHEEKFPIKLFSVRLAIGKRVRKYYCSFHVWLKNIEKIPKKSTRCFRFVKRVYHLFIYWYQNVKIVISYAYKLRLSSVENYFVIQIFIKAVL